MTAQVFPPLTIQLPLYNEPNVAARLLEAVAAIEYPGPFSIQVLDDSTDHTTEIVSMQVASMRARGIRVEHVQRGSRDGFKAGALAEGMRRSDSELFAVFAESPRLPFEDLVQIVFAVFRCRL